MWQLETETEALAPDQLDAIIRALEDGTKQLPTAAIQAARRHRAQVVPELIKLMRQATETIRSQEKKDNNGAFFALFLLAEFQATEGLPAILEAISLPGDGPFDLFGDAIHDVLPRVLVLLAKEQCQETCAALFPKCPAQRVRALVVGQGDCVPGDGRVAAARGNCSDMQRAAR